MTDDVRMPMTILALSALLYVLLNVVVFCIYWRDKVAARSNDWRIPEKTLLWLAFLGGSAGAICAQKFLRHKTRKEPFRSILLSIAILHAGLLVSLLILPDWPLRIVSALSV